MPKKGVLIPTNYIDNKFKMAFTTIIPPLKDIMSTQKTLQSLDETHPINMSDIKRFTRNSKSNRTPIDHKLNNNGNNNPGNDPNNNPNNNSNSNCLNSNCPEHNLPNDNSPNNSNKLFPKRTTSAQSVTSAFSKQQQKYQRCIEYLQSQHEQTLTSLHQEVQDLKSENKKLNFKMLLESNNPDGGVQSIVKNTLGAKVVNKTISQELLLQETIKDLQVKLDLSEDTNQHQEKTIKTLNKQMKMLKSSGLEIKKVSSPRQQKSRSSSINLNQNYRPSPPPPLKNEHIEKDKLINALKDQNKLLLDKIEEQQVIIRNLKIKSQIEYQRGSQQHDNTPRNVMNCDSNERNNGNFTVVESDSRILFNPVSSLPPINQVGSRSGNSSRNGRGGSVLTPRTSRTDISRRTKRKDGI